MPAVQNRASSPTPRRVSRVTPAAELTPVIPAAERMSTEEAVAADLRELEEMGFAVLQAKAASRY